MKEANLQRLRALAVEILESDRNLTTSDHRDDVAVELAQHVIKMLDSMGAP